jgi:hypothetical protein
MLHRADQVQDAVRRRVTPENWEAFRVIAIEGQSVAEAARFMGREYTTVYRAFTRISRMIDDERRRLDGPAGKAVTKTGSHSPST